MKPAATAALVAVVVIIVGGVGYGVFKAGNNPNSTVGCQVGYVPSGGACCPSSAPYYDPATSSCYRQPVGPSTSVSASIQTPASFSVTDAVSFGSGSGYNGFAIYTSSYNYLLTMGWGGSCGGQTFAVQDVHRTQLYSGNLTVSQGYFQGRSDATLVYTVERNDQGAVTSIVITEQDSLGRTLAVGSVSIPSMYQQAVISDKTQDYAGYCPTPT